MFYFSEQVRDNFSKLSLYDWFEKVKNLGYESYFLPTEKEIEDKLNNQPLFNTVGDIILLNLNKKYLPTKEEIEKQFRKSDIDFNDYYKICGILDIDILPPKDIMKILYGAKINNLEECFNYLIEDVKIINTVGDLVYFGKLNKIYFKYNKKEKYIYINPNDILLFKILFKDNYDELYEYFDYFIGEKINSKTLRDNCYLSWLPLGGSWIY